ncbi:LPS export ABC transporter periplasmic protein LptC [Sphingobacterium puteale]|uniref:LPS export ABC transporter periplasmic protein LptC n=1 Tax=Sphingobacterium puteale TaxID=2420510 RepID=A0A420VVY5_9SPHI|nr:LPS export ABC transporter periplasmic protein LptC [Sphingobacterium puteale]RKO70397.1 LPS export ABC transporter periplasmic protein LptC [Sphingobacterium puteale]
MVRKVFASSIFQNISPLVILFLLGALLLTSCEPDLKEVDRIANLKKEEAVDISRHVDIIYSDSTRVKANLTAPEMRIRHDSTEIYEFPKSIKIIFYDENLKETQRITSDHAVRREKEKTTIFTKNVVVTMADGSILKTEEIVYDEGAKDPNRTFYNNLPVQAFFKDQRGNLQGSSFSSDKDLLHANIQNATGVVIIKDNSLFPSIGR